ncbi:ABC transporter substrate-binding protein [Hoyosella subflava]|uniref:Putative ferric nocobactin-binding protein n=1 Tax=Hoyosella subflava (strain DSM 45089 / JCM 17490 / NBRC 109087 / DQS3-9A1) TaxID=443218 RepID=F6ERQ4_HOYSD|nr:ABC transporter substrate-binding protein [Hoyosella subflava]AEF39631.1 Putative ferric nocobactin-binding protein [Hoyosella subflava DQS3-9A1]
MRATQRAIIYVTLSIATLAGAVSCGSSDRDAGAETAPLSVEHRFGAAEIIGQPQRVVALSSQWLDALLALDLQPVAYLEDPLAGDDGLYIWQHPHIGDADPITASDTGLPLERIAAAEPDLILADYSAGEQQVYDQLNAIAPTIGMLGDEQVDPWYKQIRVIGEILGKTAQAEEIIDRVNNEVTAIARELPELAGKTAVLSQFMFDSDQIVAVADPEDGASTLFYALGMSLPDHLVTEAAGTGRLIVSPERVDILRSDLLITWPNGGDPEELMQIPGFSELPSVQGGGFAAVDIETVIALNTPSALSTEWVLNSLRPQLECVSGRC